MVDGVLEDRRIFVGSLSERITEDDLKKTFSRFGSVGDVSIKRKHVASSGPDGSSVEMFAFVNLICSQTELSRCFSLLNNTKWKGARIVVQLAKESYLDRLKREREEQQKSAKPQTTTVTVPKQIPVIKLEECTTSQPPKLVAKSPSKTSVNIKEAKNDTELTRKPIKTIASKVPETKSYNNVKIKTELETVSTPENNTENELLSRYSSKKKAFSEMKRLESQNALLQLHKQRAKEISASLLNPDKAINKKIKFGDSDTEDSNLNNNSSINEVIKPTKSQNLFDNSDDDVDDGTDVDAFKDKPQFSGKKGEKLFKLQSSYQNDPRFVLNEKFVSDSESDNGDYDHEENLVNESKKNLGILEEVLGHQVSNHDEVGNRSATKKQFKDFGFLRYDPRKPDSEKFLIKTKPEGEKSVKKKKTETKELQDEVDLTDKSQFYEVSEDLNKALASTQMGDEKFKLLVDSESESNENSDNAESPSPELNHKKPPIKLPALDQVSASDIQLTKIKKEVPDYEPFFFVDNDERLKEGVAFFYENNFNSGPNSEKRWPIKRAGLLKYMAARKKSYLKRKSRSFQFTKLKRGQPQFKKRKVNK